MSIGLLILLIIIAILAYFLLKIGLIILIIVIIIIVIYYVVSNLSRSFTNGPSKSNSLNQPATYNQFAENYVSYPICTKNDVRFDNQNLANNWYVPVQGYFREKMNHNCLSNNCQIPPGISEHCVHKHLQQTGNWNSAINQCKLPPKQSV